MMKKNLYTLVCIICSLSFYGQKKVFLDSGVYYLKKSQSVFEEIKDTLNTARSIHGISLIYADQNKYETALVYSYKALKLLESNLDDIERHRRG